MWRQLRRVAAVLGATAACSSAGSPSDLERVAVLGDSIALQSAAEIDAALEPAVVRNESAIGRRIDQAVSEAHSIALDGYEAVVVILGTNDVGMGVTNADGDEARRLAAVLGHVDCILWLAVTTSTGDPAFDAGAARLNRALRDLRGVEVVAWTERSRHPEWFADDGIHPTAEGQRALAAALDDALERC